MNEYISKHEPIEEIQRIYCTGCNSYNGAMCRACEHQDDMDIIEDTKAADVQPVKHGRWEQLVSKQSGLNYEVGARCSCCNEHTVTICICEAMPFEFCPHCGARMDGDNNG
mgnify:CR=1 FL=1